MLGIRCRRGLSGIADFLQGGVSSRVVEYFTAPVLIVRQSLNSK